jgi:hypothetical protein
VFLRFLSNPAGFGRRDGDGLDTKELPMTRILILVSLLLCPALHAEEPPPRTMRLAEGAASPPATVADLAWLSGYWQGEGLGGSCEEVWGKPSGDRMFGYFSLRNTKGHVFSEMMTMVEEGGSVVLKLKHFDPAFKGWEEKEDFVSFKLVKLGEKEAFFQGLTFRRVSEERLEIFLRLSEDGKSHEESFVFRRVAL